jgi:hypothetical protein
MKWGVEPPTPRSTRALTASSFPSLMCATCKLIFSGFEIQQNWHRRKHVWRNQAVWVNSLGDRHQHKFISKDVNEYSIIRILSTIRISNLIFEYSFFDVGWCILYWTTAAANKVNCTGVLYFDRRHAFIAWRRQVNYYYYYHYYYYYLVVFNVLPHVRHVYLCTPSVSRAPFDVQSKRVSLVGLRNIAMAHHSWKKSGNAGDAGCRWHLLYDQTADRV